MPLLALLLVMASSAASPTVVVYVGKTLGSSSHLQNVHWSPSSIALPGDSGSVYNDNALLVSSRGPLCMLQFQLGVLSQRRIGPLQLVIEYIKTGQSTAAVNILKKNGLEYSKQGLLHYHHVDYGSPAKAITRY